MGGTRIGPLFPVDTSVHTLRVGARRTANLKFHAQKLMFITGRPNQEKVFYALLERYKDDTAEYFDGKLASQPNTLKRLLSNKSGKLLKSKTGSTRSGVQGRASNKRAESGKYISLQRLHQIQESEESQGVCINPAQRCIAEKNQDGDWQDYEFAIKNNPKVKYKSNKMTEDRAFHDDDGEGVLYFKSSEPEDKAASPREPPVQGDQGKTQKRNSRPKSWVSVASHRRSVVFNHRGSSKADRSNIEQIVDSLQQDILPTRASTPGSSPERVPMGRKERAKARKKRRSSASSLYTGAVTGIATVIPVRRRAIMRTEYGDVQRRFILPVEDEDVRKVSREFSDICEAAFRTSSSVQTMLPRTLPSSAVLNETVMDLELSQLTLVPENNTPPITQRNLDKDEELPSAYSYADFDFGVPIRALEKDSDFDAVIADLDEQIKKYGSEAVGKPRLVKHKRRAVSDTIQRADSKREERRTASAPTRPTQGQNCAVAQNSQFDNDVSILNTRNFPVRTGTGILGLSYISPGGRPLDKEAKARGNPGPTNSGSDQENHRANYSSSLYVERYRQEATRLGGLSHGYNPTGENYIDGSDNIPRGRSLFSKLFDTKFGTARAPEPHSTKVKASGFWSTIGSKMGATTSKSAQECQPISGNKFFCLWNRENRKEIDSGEIHSVVQKNEC